MTISSTPSPFDGNASSYLQRSRGSSGNMSISMTFANDACFPSTPRPTRPHQKQRPVEQQQAEYIPYDYEEEIEMCSQYVFSDAATFCGCITSSSEDGATTPVVALCQEDCIPYDYDSELYASETVYSTIHASMRLEPFSTEWISYEKEQVNQYHDDAHCRWMLRMREGSTAAEEQVQFAIKSLLREACQRDVRRLRAMSAESFTVEQPLAGAPLPSSLSFVSMLLEFPSLSAVERKRAAIKELQRQWHELAEKVVREINSSAADGENYLFSGREAVMKLISGLSLFSSHTSMIRELSKASAEEGQRQRRERARQLLDTLRAQGTLFLLPTLRAEEVEEPHLVPEDLSLCTLTEEVEDELMLWSWSAPSFPCNTSNSSSANGSVSEDTCSLGPLSTSSRSSAHTSLSPMSSCGHSSSFTGTFVLPPLFINECDRDDESAFLCITFFDPITSQ